MLKVSIVIPTYNCGRFLKESIDSVLNQTYQDFELVICDDCSSDDSIDIIRSYKDKRIRAFFNEKNLGIADNWNKCVKLARGEIINIFHGDDIMLSSSKEASRNLKVQNYLI